MFFDAFEIFVFIKCKLKFSKRVSKTVFCNDKQKTSPVKNTSSWSSYEFIRFSEEYEFMEYESSEHELVDFMVPSCSNNASIMETWEKSVRRHSCRTWENVRHLSPNRHPPARRSSWSLFAEHSYAVDHSFNFSFEFM